MTCGGGAIRTHGNAVTLSRFSRLFQSEQPEQDMEAIAARRRRLQQLGIHEPFQHRLHCRLRTSQSAGRPSQVQTRVVMRREQRKRGRGGAVLGAAAAQECLVAMASRVMV